MKITNSQTIFYNKSFSDKREGFCNNFSASHFSKTFTGKPPSIKTTNLVGHLKKLARDTLVSCIEFAKIYGLSSKTVKRQAKKLGFTNFVTRETDNTRAIKEYLKTLPKDSVISPTAVGKMLKVPPPSVIKIAESNGFKLASRLDAQATAETEKVRAYLAGLSKNKPLSCIAISKALGISRFTVRRVAIASGFKIQPNTGGIKTGAFNTIQNHFANWPKNRLADCVEIGEILGVDPSGVRRVAKQMKIPIVRYSSAPWHLSEKVGMFHGENAGINLLTGEKFVSSPYDVLDSMETTRSSESQRNKLLSALGRLKEHKPNEYRIVSSLFGLEGQPAAKVHDLSEELGIHAAEMERIMKNTMKTLKEELVI